MERDQDSAFQAELELRCPQGFVPRLDPQASRDGGDWDQAVNALQFRDACEYGVGRNVGVEVDLDADGGCSRLRTTWMPQANVEKVHPGKTWAVNWRMEALDRLASRRLCSHCGRPDAAGGSLPRLDRASRLAVSGLNSHQQATGERLLGNARTQAERIARGIEALAESDIREAFAIANRAMAAGARQRSG